MAHIPNEPPFFMSHCTTAEMSYTVLIDLLVHDAQVGPAVHGDAGRCHRVLGGRPSEHCDHQVRLLGDPPGYVSSKYICRVGHPFFSKERSDLCILFRSL